MAPQLPPKKNGIKRMDGFVPRSVLSSHPKLHCQTYNFISKRVAKGYVHYISVGDSVGKQCARATVKSLESKTVLRAQLLIYINSYSAYPRPNSAH